jgi:serine/threonine protein kinase, bacterial
MLKNTSTNQLLNNRYQLINILGTGGMGQTYIAEDTLGNRKCVVKQLKPASNEPSFLVTARRLFKNEAIILEKLGRMHDQIPQCYDYFEEEEEFYLVQDLIEGHPLSAEMNLGQRWLESQVIQLLIEVISILKLVHAQGVIHRDIKPDNLIRCEKDGKLVLIDFGAVKQVRLYQSLTSTQVSSVVIGTPGYMPTEQCQGKPRYSSDLYAIGMVAIQALTGLLPKQLREDKDGEVIWREQAEVSDELATILSKMVRYHFKDRYETATETLEALQQRKNNTVSNSDDLQKPPQIYSLTQMGKTAAYTPTVPSTNIAEQENNNHTTSKEKNRTPTSTPQPIQPDESNIPTSSSKKYRLLFCGGIAVVLTTLIAGGSYTIYWQQNRNDLKVQLEQIKTLLMRGEYTQCINQVGSFSRKYSDIYSQAQILLTQCRQAQSEKTFVEAQNLASKGQFINAINKLQEIPSDSSSSEKVKSLIDQWSKEILSLASKVYGSGKLDSLTKSINLAKAVPQNTSAYREAQESIANWNDEWQANEKIMNQANNLLEKGNWGAAIDKANTVTLQGKTFPQDSEYMQNVVNPFISKVEAKRREVEAKRREDKANEIARYKNPINKSGILAPNQPNVKTRTDDGTLFIDYGFDGKKGEKVTIRLDGDFDTRLYLIPPDSSEEEAYNDDITRTNRNSSIPTTLNKTGFYRVRVNGYSKSDTGSYSLNVYREMKNY